MLHPTVSEVSLPRIQIDSLRDSEPDVIQPWAALIELFSGRSRVLIQTDDQAAVLVSKDDHDAVFELCTGDSVQSQDLAIPGGTGFHIGH